eukprot:TRINITY_DN1743_c0_g1_i2.p1 TRINITY_DN1743_c0_g1~~TRINITY_DN1743_c0_g1_i2.p1  ORF type:complete len:111 (-),score=25.40 TRINITY_DN1743_c0_g1_i2:85-417(-)
MTGPSLYDVEHEHGPFFGYKLTEEEKKLWQRFHHRESSWKKVGGFLGATSGLAVGSIVAKTPAMASLWAVVGMTGSIIWASHYTRFRFHQTLINKGTPYASWYAEHVNSL